MTDGLCLAVERQVLLTRPKKDGTTLYDHLKQVEKVKGTWPEQYLPLPPPEGTEHVWDVFWELRSRAAVGFNGPEGISFLEIDAWERVRALRLEQFFVDMILRMDAAYMAEWYRKQRTGG